MSKSKRVSGLVRKAQEPGSSWEPGKVSEMIIEFARPLLEAEPGGPPDIQTLRNVMMLVSMCWNLPVLELRNDPELKKHLHLFENVPGPIKGLLDGLMKDRRTKFGSIPFLVLVEVKGTSLEDAVIRAEARMSPGSTAGWS